MKALPVADCPIDPSLHCERDGATRSLHGAVGPFLNEHTGCCADWPQRRILHSTRKIVDSLIPALLDACSPAQRLDCTCFARRRTCPHLGPNHLGPNHLRSTSPSPDISPIAFRAWPMSARQMVSHALHPHHGAGGSCRCHRGGSARAAVRSLFGRYLPEYAPRASFWSVASLPPHQFTEVSGPSGSRSRLRT